MSEDFSANKPLGTLATSQGEFLVFNITVGHQEHVRKDLGKPLDKSEPVDFARAMIKYTCQRAEPQANDAASPVPALATLDVQSFSPEDIEAFAKFYVESNQYLYRKFESENPNGLGEVVYPKQEKESFTAYLHRISVLHKYYLYRVFDRGNGSYELAVLKNPINDETGARAFYEINLEAATRTEEFNLAGGITENIYRHNLDSPEPQK